MKWRRRSGKRWARPASAGGEGSTTGGGPAASAPRAQEPARAAAGQRREARAAPPRNARRVCLIVNAGPVPIVRDDGGGHFGHDGPAMWTALVDSLVYFPDRRLYGDPGDVSLAFTGLAIEEPPLACVLQSTFTSLRDIARAHYPPALSALAGEAYPSLQRIPRLRAPLLILHGDEDEIVPMSHAEALFAAAPEPRRLR